MKITYKDVGQGDSIILEWQSDGVNKIGIIDCNKKGKINPVLDHLKLRDYDEIEFIILSHPHRDHYSGMLQLLDYIDKNNISIKYLGHTLVYAGNTAYWRYFEINSSDTRLLNTLIKRWRQLREKGIIKRVFDLSEGKMLNLAQNINLHCISPSHDDAQEYQRIVEADADKNMKEASQAANHLSTVFRLTIDNKCNVLFTSDAENFNFEGIVNREGESFDDYNFQLCQLPHHGSEKNFYPEFWSLLNTAENKHAIASAGKHRHYNHPSFNVLKTFHDAQFDVHCTNILNGMEEFTHHLETIKKISRKLDGISTLAEEYRVSGDRVFIYSDGVINLV